MREPTGILPAIAGDDGASASDEVPGISGVADIPLLMDAWAWERQHRVELSLLLRRARRLLRRIEDEGSLPPRRAHQVRAMLDIMREMDRADRDDAP
jgi:hypothetical protein